jgi:hypothetical protein
MSKRIFYPWGLQVSNPFRFRSSSLHRGYRIMRNSFMLPHIQETYY